MPIKPSPVELGRIAEQAALSFLMGKGLTLLTRNYACRLGEIDLIMRDSDQLVFVEVRLRSNRFYGDGLASITRQKQKRIILAAKHFLSSKSSFAHFNCRFDVVAISRPNGVFCHNWIRNAFSDYN